MAEPSVSVVIPVRNGAAFIGEAVRSAQAQSCAPLEIVVVDDGSTDDTPGVVRAFETVRYVRREPAGQAAARNFGVSSTVGSVIAFLDADDVWLSDKLERQVAALRSDPGLDIVYGHTRLFGDAFDGGAEPPTPSRLPSAMVVRREAFERVGPFDERLALGENIAWCARADDLGLRSRMLDEVVCLRRVHGANTALLTGSAKASYLAAVRSILGARRGGGP